MSEITITGNAVEAPTLTYTPTGTAVASIRLARTERFRDAQGQWKDGEPLYINVACWRQLAENVAESVVKGTRLVVSGKLRTRSYTDKRVSVKETGEDAERFVTEITADDVAVSLKSASAKVAKTERTQATGGDDEAPF